MFFELNEGFSTLEEIEARKKLYEREKKVILTISKGEKGHAKVSKALVYKRLVYNCKAGKERPSESRNIRKARTGRVGCPFVLRFGLDSRIPGKLVVKEFIDCHENHDTDEATYAHYPENLRLPEAQIAKAKSVISCHGNIQMLKSQLEKEEQHPVSSKYLHNLRAKMQLEKKNAVYGTSDLEKMISEMQKVPGAKIHVAQSSSNELIGVYFQDQRMAEMFDAYPELVIFDATYKLNEYRMPLFVMLVVDGTGQSQIVCFWIIPSESEEAVRSMAETFKQFNPKSDQIRVLLGDKDLADRKVFQEVFPEAHLEICLFHVLRTFKREIQPESRNVTRTEKEKVLQILQDMAYAKSQDQFDRLYTELQDLELPKVMEYFDNNWLPIIEQWTLFGRNEHTHYLNRTSNRLESLNQKFKLIISRYSNLVTFFQDLNTVVDSMASDRDFKAIKENMRRPRSSFGDEVLELYQDFLTQFAFNHMKDQYKKSENISFNMVCDNQAHLEEKERTLTTSATSCSCGFRGSMELPCRHIFAFRRVKDLPLYEESLSSRRWSRGYQRQVQQKITQTEVSATGPPPVYQSQATVPRAEMTKYQLAAKITKKINEKLETLPDDQFDYYMEKLKTFEAGVKSGLGLEVQVLGVLSEGPQEPAQRADTEPMATAGPSSARATPSQLSQITLPEKRSAVGRQKGVGDTVIGRQRGRPRRVRALDKPSEAQDKGKRPAKKSQPAHFIFTEAADERPDVVQWIMLRWLVSNESRIHEVLNDGSLITEEEVEVVLHPRVRQKLCTTEANLGLIREYFDAEAWAAVNNHIDAFEAAGGFKCCGCEKALGDRAVQCDQCLDWFHYECAGFQRKPKRPHYYCEECLEGLPEDLVRSVSE